jgi:hypothetical protein
MRMGDFMVRRVEMEIWFQVRAVRRVGRCR